MQVLPNSHLAQLVFGQPHTESAPWFAELSGGTNDIGVEHFPPARYLSTRDDAELFRYFRASWPHYGRTCTEESRSAHAEWIRDTAASTSEITEPVRVVRRPCDGKFLVIDGNHRASFAYHNGLDLPYVVMSASEWLDRMTKNGGEFFGTQHKGIPYQTVHNYDGSPVFTGRRDDMLTRHSLIDPDDLRSKSVIDVGCNIGTASFLADWAGATSVIGFDISELLVTSAMRMGVYVNSDACFLVADANTTETLPKCDTLFLFSVAAHTNEVRSLLPVIQQTDPEVVYIEAHDGWSWESFKDLHSAFKTVEPREGGVRKMWRCTR